MRAEILEHDGDILKLRIFDKLTEEEKRRYEINGRLFSLLEMYDPESITVAQQNHIYALIGDISFYTGYPKAEWERYIKENFKHFDFLPDIPSFALNKMSKAQASKVIEYIVIFCIREEIPFRKDQFYLPRESSNYVFWATMKRNCVVCGKPHAQIHHFDTVGMGRNRNKVDHTKLRVMALCTDHHKETHTIGDKEFYKKHLVKPVKLNKRQLKELGM